MSLLSLDQIKTLYDDLRGRIEDGGSVINFLPVDNASGSIASFPDGADDVPVKSLIAQITPLQDLHGQSAPYPAGGGKNKLGVFIPTASSSGVTLTNKGDGTYTITGTKEGTGTLTLNSGKVAFSFSAGNYILNGKDASECYFEILFYSGNTIVLDQYCYNADDVSFTLSSDIDYIDFRVRVSSGASPSGTLAPMIRLSTESDPTFAPYSNECPISGWTGAKITRAGKNLLPSDLTWVNNKYIKEDGTIATLNGFHYSSMFEIKPNTQYAVQYYVAAATSGSFLVNLYDGSMNVLGWAVPIAASPSAAGTYSGEFTSPATAAYARISTNNQYTNLQFELGSTATTYEAYNGNTIDVDWTSEGTVYGGTLTYIGGGKYSLQATRAKLTLDGSQAIGNSTYGGAENKIARWTLPSSAPSGAATDLSGLVALCDTLAPTQRSYAGDFASWAADASRHNTFAITTNGTRIAIALNNNAITSDALMNAYLQANPITFAYELATLPDPIILDAEDVKTLLGDNNIFCDTGDVSVDYRADIALYIQKVVNA